MNSKQGDEGMSKLKGKIASVTGASRGIGRGIAQEGAFVAVHYGKRQNEAEDVVHKIEQSGGAAFTIGADLSTLNGIHDYTACRRVQLTHLSTSWLSNLGAVILR
jgi:NAD(P)-dependent dehydrogenase (short-subunit alcohol dehydrogenase family)